MDKSNLLLRIQEEARRQDYRLTSHAETERESDKITGQEIQESLLSPDIEVIEHYPEDVRCESCLVLGFTENHEPLHLVCGLGGEMLVIVTVYRPDPRQWINWRQRKQ